MVLPLRDFSSSHAIGRALATGRDGLTQRRPVLPGRVSPREVTHGRCPSDTQVAYLGRVG